MKKDNSFINQFISFCVVMILPVVMVSIIVVLFCFMRIERGTKDLNVKMLEQANTVMNAELGQVATVGYKVAKSEPVAELLASEYTDDEMLNVLLWRCKKSLRLYVMDGNIIDNMAVYSIKNDIIINNSTVYSIDEYYSEFARGADGDAESFAAILRGGAAKPMFLSADNQLIYCQTIKNVDNKPAGCFIAALNKKQIELLLADAGVSEKTGFALSCAGDILMLSGNFNEKLFSKTDGAGEFKSGHRYVLTYHSETVRGLDFSYSISERDFIGSTRITAMLILLTVLATIGISSLFGRKSVNRAKTIISEIYNENRLLNSNLDVQIKKIKNQVLRNALMGGVSDPEKNNIGFTGDKIRVMLAEFEYVGGVRAELDEVVDEHFRHSGAECRIVTGMEGGSAYILSYKTDFSTEKILIGLEKKFQREIGINVFFAVGAEVESIGRLCESYETAAFVLRCAPELRNERSVAYYEDIKIRESTRIFYPKEKSARIAADMRLGLSAETEAHFDELYEKNFTERQLSAGALRQLLISIMSTLYEVIDRIYQDKPEKSDEFGRVCRNIMRGENAEDAFETLKRISIALCEKAQKGSSDSDMRETINRYMEQNYTNPNLSLDVMADELGISYYYLSRLFGEYMGMSFLSCLTSMRLEYACELLDTTSLKVEEISERCGFLNCNSFIRVFKKYYNVTPGKWRKKP